MRSRWRCGHANKTTTPDWSTAPTGVRKVESTGPRNTSGVVGGVDVRVRDRQRAVRVYRGQLPSPGPPTVASRAEPRSSSGRRSSGTGGPQGAASGSRCHPQSAPRWFRHAGGANPNLTEFVSGRYLSFHEREELGLCCAQRSASARWNADWVGHRRRSRVSCAGTCRRARIGWTIGRRQPSGIGAASAPLERRSWRSTIGCESPTHVEVDHVFGDLANPGGNQYELNCYDFDRIKTELIEPDTITAVRYWPRELYDECARIT